MATARERAEKAAKATLSYDYSWWQEDNVEKAADAASDVWEPLLQECYNLFEILDNSEASDLMSKLKEALGD